MQNLFQPEALPGRRRLTPTELLELTLEGGALPFGGQRHVGIVRKEAFPPARKLVNPRLDAAE